MAESDGKAPGEPGGGVDRHRHWSEYEPVSALFHSLCELVGVGGAVVVCLLMTVLTVGALLYLLWMLLS